MNMNIKLLLQTPAAIFLLVASLAASAQPAPQLDPATGLAVRAGRQPSPVFNPATGLPVQSLAPAPVFDPATGLPIAPAAVAEPQWIDPSWTDPNIVLTNVSYNGLPLSEVARDLRERFKNHFDILPMPRTFDRDWGSDITIQLQLKNVKASEVFNAMNLVFDNDHTPVRWELKMNGNRPVALLRVLPEGAPQPFPPQAMPAETHRMVIYIGNLIGDEKSGGLDMKQIFNTILTVWPTDFGKLDGVIQFHEQAQLIVVNGTREQIDFIQQTLKALQQKANADSLKKMNAGSATDTQKRLNQMRQTELDQTQNTQKTGSGGGQ
jgi:hypothetical protein